MQADLPIACELDVARLEERRSLLREVATSATERHERPDGLTLTFDAGAGVLPRLGRLLELERRCCRFLRVRVTVEPGEGRTELALDGPAGSGAYVASLWPEGP